MKNINSHDWGEKHVFYHLQPIATM